MNVLVERRFRGFEGIALGGYVGGLLAAALPSAEVKLRRPVPLERPLRVEESEQGERELVDGEVVLARVRPAPVEVSVPAPVSLAEGLAASARSLQRSGVVHSFRGCFTCGDGRSEGDGLRIFAGPVPGREVVAALWTSGEAFADSAGRDGRGLFAVGAVLSREGGLLALARHRLAVASWGVPLGREHW
ncbi:MAG TPA: hypothetical protein VFG53_12735 [Anaeromyxobacter sp.]|nr:hypothetical protein [Anaeromyxobacter sp.]